MRIAFFTLFSVIALWHLCCTIFVAYAALWTGDEKLWIYVPIAFIPLFVLISYARSKRWSGAHRTLAVVALVPAVWIAADEFFRPHTPNRAWLSPVILIYVLALIGALTIKPINEQKVGAHE
jgi:hypothetical protein